MLKKGIDRSVARQRCVPNVHLLVVYNLYEDVI